MKKRAKKYYNAQTEEVKICEHEGCSKPAEYKAPKDSTLKEYHWFCLDHVREYNLEWDFYSGMSKEELEEEEKKCRYWGNKTHRYGTSPNGKTAKTKSKVKYAFGYKIRDAFDLFDDDEIFESGNFSSGYLSGEENNLLKTMECAVEERNIEAVKKQYKILVKKYHPDLNPDNKEAEEKFKKISIAYNELMDLWKSGK